MVKKKTGNYFSNGTIVSSGDRTDLPDTAIDAHFE